MASEPFLYNWPREDPGPNESTDDACIHRLEDLG